MCGESTPIELWESPFRGFTASGTKLKPVAGGLGLEALLLGKSGLEAKVNELSTSEGVFGGAKSDGIVTSPPLINALVTGGLKVLN